MKNITLSADEALIEEARARARADQTTLNEQFRLWLRAYAQQRNRGDEAMAVVAAVRGSTGTGGRRFTRDEMNER
jgi:hypothetical protein